MLLGLLAGLQIADGDDVMGPSGKDDRPQDQLDRGHRAVEMAQLRLDGLVRSGQQFSACDLARKTAVKPCTGEVGCRQARQQGKTGVDGDDHLSVANQKPLDGGIREIAHPVDFEFGTSAVSDIEHDTRQRQSDDSEARDRHPHRQPSGGQRRLRNLDGGIGNDRHGTHSREVMAADRQRQQQRAADLPFLFLAMKADGKCDGSDCGAEHDRCDDKNRIPQDRAGNFKRRHPGVVHRGNATGHDGAADPRPVAPARAQRHPSPTVVSDIAATSDMIVRMIL